MSKERARARAARAAVAAERAQVETQRRERHAVRRARRERRDLAWRRVRLWQHGSAYRRRKEQIAGLLTLDLVLMLLACLVTRSVGAVLFVALVVLIATPALAMLTSDRRRR